jgi:hypothetical protein
VDDLAAGSAFWLMGSSATFLFAAAVGSFGDFVLVDGFWLLALPLAYAWGCTSWRRGGCGAPILLPLMGDPTDLDVMGIGGWF